MKAIITNASEVRIDGAQSVSFNIVDKDGDVLVSTTLEGDVDTLRDQVSQAVADYEAKAKSEKRLKEGDVIS